MLWGRRIMRREMVWARENRNRTGLAHSKGWAVTSEAISARHVVCTLGKGQDTKSVPS